MTAPMADPITLPTPPVRLIPPSTQAATAVISYPLPLEVVTIPIRLQNRMPAIDAITEQTI